MERALLIVKSCERRLAHMVNPIELALINFFILILILLDGIAKIGSKKSDDCNPV